ncbi:glycosyl transferase [Cryobacterium sp. LW097]|uniref:glycosyltransferase family 2 protein n=1 Tax=unclassified Cryobacterium TaxID=2649013 RepID=UPI000B4DA1BC|nr:MULTISPECIES: glycosyltransferase [unclassified Cryobacterium]ASD21464.1 glycosyl transferase [Cryobacterium sp. LW097]TFC84840.1 glycosyltransferase family 2 protein [Cryobacterium sp. TMT4-31]
MPVTIGVVVLTQGRRPDDLERGIRSLLAQEDVQLDIICVGNGWQPTGLPSVVAALALPENLGIPAGRNRGVEHVGGDYLFFLDDDASLPDPRFLIDAVGVLRADPSIGLLQPQVVDPAGLTAPRRWIPRIRKGDAAHSSAVFSVWEGAVLLPRPVFDATGGWAEPFFYAHEGIELAWRVWDQGLRTWYAGNLVANHPVILPTRHADFYRLNARNRVWIARRNLPLPLIPLYVGSWTAIQVLRGARNPAALKAWFRGWWEGWVTDPGERRPLATRTIWRMTRAGRPPVI